MGFKGFDANDHFKGEPEYQNFNFRMAVAIVGWLVGNGHLTLDFEAEGWEEEFKVIVREVKTVLDGVQ